MKLIKDGNVQDTKWTLHDDQALEALVIDDEAFLANPDSYLQTQDQTAVSIDVDTNLDTMVPHLDNLSLLVIKFASFADGRGFSIAHRLRHSYGYKGALWASGNVIPDQYAMALQCGIDAILVEEEVLKRQPIEDWSAALAGAPTPPRFQDDMNTNASADTRSPDELVAKLNTDYAGMDTQTVLKSMVKDQRLGNIALVSSFGTQSIVLLHLISEAAPQLPVLFLDTGKLFPETLAYQAQIIEQLSLTNVITLHPETSALEKGDAEGNLWQSSTTACCDIRKVQPLQNALAGYDTWVSGRKSYQSQERATLQLFEHSDGHIKINPLAGWTPEMLVEYMSQHNLTSHPLVAQGYPSVGCAPCTSPVVHGEDERAGRWRDIEKTECGIHFNPNNPASDPQSAISSSK